MSKNIMSSEDTDKQTRQGSKSALRLSVAGILFVAAIGHGFFPSRFTLDWPAATLLALSVVICGWHRVEAFLPFIKRLRVGEAEIEMQEKTKDLAQAVQGSERDNEQASADETQLSLSGDLAERGVENEILNLAAQDKPSAIIRLAIELEREILTLQGMLGLRNQARTNTLAEALRQLKDHKAISARIASAVEEFWEIRNGLLHGTSTFPASLLTSFLDSGIRLLALIKAVPRPTYVVADPMVKLFRDPELKMRIEEYYGVRIATSLPDGGHMTQVFPAGRPFEQGEVVGWDWDSGRKFGPAYYLDTDGKALLAWSQSVAFVGRPAPLAR